MNKKKSSKSRFSLYLIATAAAITFLATLIANGEVIGKFVSEQLNVLGIMKESCLSITEFSMDQSSIYQLRDFSSEDQTFFADPKNYKVSDPNFFKGTTKIVDLKKKITTEKNNVPILLLLLKNKCTTNIVIKEVVVEVMSVSLSTKKIYAMITTTERPISPLGYQRLPTEMYEIKISNKLEKYEPYKIEQKRPISLNSDNYINFGIAISAKDAGAVPLNALLKVKITFVSDTKQLSTEPFFLRLTSL